MPQSPLAQPLRLTEARWLAFNGSASDGPPQFWIE